MEFAFSVGLHLQMRKAVDDVKRKDTSIISDDALSSTNAHRAVINLVAVRLNLARRMCRPIEAVIGTLTQDKDNGTAIREGLGRGINKLKGVELVIVNASDVNFTGMDMEYNGVIPDDATVGTSIHEGSMLAAGMGTYGISDNGGTDTRGGGRISNLIHMHFIVKWRTS